jgi:hypothetical protein
MWVVKMSNGRGLVEWYESLSYRVQAADKESARHFQSEEAAQRTARMCESMPDAFSEGYWDGKWTLTAVVEPL